MKKIISDIRVCLTLTACSLTKKGVGIGTTSFAIIGRLVNDTCESAAVGAVVGGVRGVRGVRGAVGPWQNRDMILLGHLGAQFKISNEAYGSLHMHIELNEDGLMLATITFQG